MLNISSIILSVILLKNPFIWHKYRKSSIQRLFFGTCCFTAPYAIMGGQLFHASIANHLRTSHLWKTPHPGEFHRNLGGGPNRVTSLFVYICRLWISSAREGCPRGIKSHIDSMAIAGSASLFAGFFHNEEPTPITSQSRLFYSGLR